MEFLDALPSALSSSLVLTHPTPYEMNQTSILTAHSWKDALSLDLYLQESHHLATVPLAKNGGMTLWILTFSHLRPDQRPILSSCETFRKRALVADHSGNVGEKIIHGVASVFCDIAYRGRGYTARMMRELATSLRTWQCEGEDECVGSILYSDIGKKYYANLGWKPSPNNKHIVFLPSPLAQSAQVRQVYTSDLAQLCQEDEANVRANMSKRPDRKAIMTIIPDHDHMLWHHAKEEFSCGHLFGKIPHAKGALVGEPGNRIWAIWTHRYYGQLNSPDSGNTLYILRLVIENQNLESADTMDESSMTDVPEIQLEQLSAVLQAAQCEAAHWKLHSVKLWDPTPLVLELIKRTGIQHCEAVRNEESIASLLWFGDDNWIPTWINNEKYAWC